MPPFYESKIYSFGTPSILILRKKRSDITEILHFVTKLVRQSAKMLKKALDRIAKF